MELRGIAMKLIVGIFALLLTYNISYAGWINPIEVVSLSFGSGFGQVGIEHGDSEDIFPTLIRIDENGNIVIPDGINNRLYLFSRNSLDILYKNNSSAPYLAANKLLLKVSADEYMIIDYNGDVIKKFKGPVWTNRIIPTIDAFYIYEWKEKVYYKYSIVGELLKTYAERPLELGVIDERRSGVGERKYKTLIKYPDHTYEVYSRQPFRKYYRDRLKNLYRIESFAEKKGDEYINAYRVFRYGICGNKDAEFEMPKSEYEQMSPEAANHPTGISIPVIEYGEPIISSTGDIYCWARTKTEYKIMKWTLQGEAKAPQTLKATPSAKNVALSWEPPREDAKSVTEYEIYRAGDVCGPYSAIARINKNVLQYEDAVQKTGDLVFYQVRAIRGKDHSGYSNKVFAKVSKK